MQRFTRNTYEFVKQGLLQIQDEITKGERVCANRALKKIIGTLAPNKEALLGYAYVRVRNRVGSKYGNTDRRAEIIAEKVQILMEAFWARPTHYVIDTDQYGAKFINTSADADMSLEDAVRFAEMDGVVMIRDLNLGKGFERYYLDTARNREILKHYETREEEPSEREVFGRKHMQSFRCGGCLFMVSHYGNCLKQQIRGVRSGKRTLITKEIWKITFLKKDSTT